MEGNGIKRVGAEKGTPGGDPQGAQLRVCACAFIQELLPGARRSQTLATGLGDVAR